MPPPDLSIRHDRSSGGEEGDAPGGPIHSRAVCRRCGRSRKRLCQGLENPPSQHPTCGCNGRGENEGSDLQETQLIQRSVDAGRSSGASNLVPEAGLPSALDESDVQADTPLQSVERQSPIFMPVLRFVSPEVELPSALDESDVQADTSLQSVERQSPPFLQPENWQSYRVPRTNAPASGGIMRRVAASPCRPQTPTFVPPPRRPNFRAPNGNSVQANSETSSLPTRCASAPPAEQRTLDEVRLEFLSFFPEGPELIQALGSDIRRDGVCRLLDVMQIQRGAYAYGIRSFRQELARVNQSLEDALDEAADSRVTAFQQGVRFVIDCLDRRGELGPEAAYERARLQINDPVVPPWEQVLNLQRLGQPAAGAPPPVGYVMRSSPPPLLTGIEMVPSTSPLMAPRDFPQVLVPETSAAPSLLDEEEEDPEVLASETSFASVLADEDERLPAHAEVDGE